LRKAAVMSSISVVFFLAACGGGVQDNEGGNTEEAGLDMNNDAAEASGDGKVMRMHSADAENRPSPMALEEFKEIVEEETDGGIEVQVYHSAQFGGDREAFEGLQIGSVEGAVMSTGPVANFLPEMGVFDLPFIFPDHETAYEVLDGEVGEELLDDLGSQGVVGLGYWENGMRHLTTADTEVSTVEDIEGLDIRTMESEIHIDAWNELGANPTPMAWPEVYSGLQQGVIDGQENPAGNVTSNNLYEVQDYLIKTGHVYAANVFMISEQFWNELTEEEQQIVEEAALETREVQREFAAEEDEEAFAELEEIGMNISELSEEEQDRLFEAVQPVYEQYEDVFGQDLIDRVVEQTR
jgi:TRAP-type transport system periplasmic protein